MEFVQSFDILGVKSAQIPCILGNGAPTTATPGAVGCFYMDTLSEGKDLYKCVAVNGNVYTWVSLLGDISAALDSIIAIQNELIGGDSA